MPPAPCRVLRTQREQPGTGARKPGLGVTERHAQRQATGGRSHVSITWGQVFQTTVFGAVQTHPGGYRAREDTEQGPAVVCRQDA